MVIDFDKPVCVEGDEAESPLVLIGREIWNSSSGGMYYRHPHFGLHVFHVEPDGSGNSLSSEGMRACRFRNIPDPPPTLYANVYLDGGNQLRCGRTRPFMPTVVLDDGEHVGTICVENGKVKVVEA